MVTIKTDRNYFQYVHSGIQIHSGKVSGLYDAEKLKAGKYLPAELMHGKFVFVDTTTRPDIFIWKIVD